MALAVECSSRVDSDFLSVTLAVASERLLEERFTIPLVVTVPAAGADWVVKVPGGSVWELLSVRATLTTSAVVANRVPQLNYLDADGQPYASFPAGGNTPASSNFAFNWVQGIGYQNAVNPFVIGLPATPIPLSPGFRITVATVGIDVTDQWSTIRMLVRQWSEAEIAQECVELVEQFDSFTSRLLGTGVR